MSCLLYRNNKKVVTIKSVTAVLRSILQKRKNVADRENKIIFLTEELADVLGTSVLHIEQLPHFVQSHLQPECLQSLDLIAPNINLNEHFPFAWPCWAASDYEPTVFLVPKELRSLMHEGNNLLVNITESMARDNPRLHNSLVPTCSRYLFTYSCIYITLSHYIHKHSDRLTDARNPLVLVLTDTALGNVLGKKAVTLADFPREIKKLITTVNTFESS